MPFFCGNKISKHTSDTPDDFEIQIGQTLLELENSSELKAQLKDLSITGAKQIDVGDKKVSAFCLLYNNLICIHLQTIL